MAIMSSGRLLVKQIFVVFTICLVWLSVPANGYIHQRTPGGVHLRTLKRGGINTNQSDGSSIWQPRPGVKWQIQLENAVEDTSINAEVYDIDLFDNSAETISAIHKHGTKVICYFSAGTYEEWRSDADQFSSSDFGSSLDDWPGERWLDINSSNVRRILSARLDMAQKKGCDGVDPDNIDGYDNENGLGLTTNDSINLLKYLANEAHSRGMSIGLKNGGDIISDVIDNMQWSVNEQCAQYNECDTYAAFTSVNKPVFHIEYSGEDVGSQRKLKIRVTEEKKSDACHAEGAEKFSTVIKNMNLSAWVEYC
jgi:endo-alpha-1,4-polygalactosaminidase (GH114 family)